MPTKNISRRDFLKTAGLSLVTASAACSGLGYAATRNPELETPEFIFRKENAMTDNKSGVSMQNRVLVTYATRAGSTSEVAAAIGESLGKHGYSVDVKPVKTKPDLNGYQAVIMGSAIRMGSWLPEAVDFIKTNQQALNKLPVALFSVHMQNTADDEASHVARLAYLESVRPMLKTAEEVFFTGKMDFSRLSFLDRLIAGMVKAVEADKRDWEKIRSWVPSFSA